MAGITNLTAQIQALDAQLSSAWGNLQQMRSVFTEFSRLKLQATDPQDIRQLDQKLKLLRENLKVMGDTSNATEKNRREIEQLVGSNKAWLAVLEKIDPMLRKVGGSVTGLAKGVSALKSGDLGGIISAVGQTTGVFKGLTSVLGMTINAYVKFQDRVQITNKTIIDANAAVGKFAQGMHMATTEGHRLRASIAGYSQFVGLSTAETEKAVNSLADLGFSMKEMGFDDQTKQIKTVTDSIREQSGEWGALAASLAIARFTGLDQSKVMSQMQFQVKSLGGSVKDVAATFSELSAAASRSSLSTAILTPILRGAQESFKYLGIDSSEAARALGEAGKAARGAGLGSQAASELMGKAMSSMADMDFGAMTFMGQQMGMGEGLTAGFQFRQQAAAAPGAVAQDVGRVSAKLMGGTGDIVSEEQARSNDYLASIRLGQETLVSQFTGMSAKESRAYLNLVEQMNTAKAQGKDTKEMADKLKTMEEGEAGYRTKTLTMQQKISQLLEVITSVVGRMLITFVRAFAGGAKGAEGGLAGLLSKTLSGIEKGQGIDEIFKGDKGGTFEQQLNKSFGGVEAGLESFGKKLGGAFSFFFGSLEMSIVSIIGLKMGSDVISKAFSVGISSILSKTLGSLWRLMAGKTAVGTIVGGAAEAAGTATGWASWGAKGAGATAPAVGALTRNAGILTRLFGSMGGAAGGVLRMFTGLTSLLPGLVALGPALAVVAAGALAFAATSWFVEMTGLGNVAGKLTTAFLGADAAVKEHNKELLRSLSLQKAKSKESGFASGNEAEEALRATGGGAGMAAVGGIEKAKAALNQSITRSGDRMGMYEKELATSEKAIEDLKNLSRNQGWGPGGFGGEAPPELQAKMKEEQEKADRMKSAIKGERAQQSSLREQTNQVATLEQLSPEKQKDALSKILSAVKVDTVSKDDVTKNERSISEVMKGLGGTTEGGAKKTGETIAAAMAGTVVNLVHTPKEKERIGEIMRQRSDLADDSIGASPEEKKIINERKRELGKELDTIQKNALARSGKLRDSDFRTSSESPSKIPSESLSKVISLITDSQAINPADAEKYQRATNPRGILLNQSMAGETLKDKETKDKKTPSSEQSTNLNVKVTVEGDGMLKGALNKTVQTQIENGNVAPGPGSKSQSGVGTSTGYR